MTETVKGTEIALLSREETELDSRLVRNSVCLRENTVRRDELHESHSHSHFHPWGCTQCMKDPANDSQGEVGLSELVPPSGGCTGGPLGHRVIRQRSLGPRVFAPLGCPRLDYD